MVSARNPSQNGAASRLPGLLRKASTRPTKDVVHKLRTTIRRVETSMQGGDSSDARLSKQLKRIRKRAGQVRDIDVQLALLEELNRSHHKDVIAVTKALQEMREKQERKIRKLISQELDDSLIKRLRKGTAEPSAARPSHVDAKAIADEFSAAVRQRPLTEDNLHEFRTTTKKLRYRAELTTASAKRDDLIADLKKVQDAIGQWHDGVTLSDTAEEVLGDAKRNSLLSLLRTQDHSRFLEALRTVERGRASIDALFSEAPGKKPVQTETSIPRREAVRA